MNPNLSEQPSRRPRVVLGLLGTKLDGIRHDDRWTMWRPSPCVVKQGDWSVDRFELMYQAGFDGLAEFVMRDMRGASPHTEVRGHFVDFGPNPWDFESVFDALLAFAEGYPFDPEAEDYYVHITTGTHVAQICLFLLTETRRFPAKLLQSAPRHGVPKPERATGRIDVIDLDLARYDRLATRFARERTEAHEVLKGGIATRNPTFNDLIARIEQVALLSRDPVLLTGPTGAGKSLLARRIYDLRRRRAGLKGEFVEVNCATLRGDAAMSALFGHVKGAFTGAARDRPGLLRAAHGGMLFLDEIGELGADEQAMLLRAVEDRVFSPLGSDRPVHSDFQLVAGTNRDLRARGDRPFRDDLLARIDVWTFRLPGLAERPEDIEPNLDWELERAGRRLGRRIAMNREARDRFLKFATAPDAAWPGNFRELNAAVTRMATLAPRGRIHEDLVAEECARLRDTWSRRPESPNAPLPPAAAAALAAPMDDFDRVQLERVLRTCLTSRSMADAGRRLFAVSRLRRSAPNDSDRVRKLLRKANLTWDDLHPAAGGS